MQKIDLTNINLSGGSGGGEGSSVQWTQKVHEGTNIAEINIDGATTQIYAPEGGATGGVTEEQLEDVEQAASNAINDLQQTVEDVSIRLLYDTVNQGVYEEDQEVIAASINQLIRDKVDAVTAGAKLWIGTQAEYNALGTYDNNTLYAIK